MGLPYAGRGFTVHVDKPISSWPRQDIIPLIKEKDVIVAMSDSLYSIVFAVYGKNQWLARDLVHHQQGLQPAVNKACMDETVARFMRVLHVCRLAGARSITVIAESNMRKCPNLRKIVTTSRDAKRQTAIDDGRYSDALRVTDCIFVAALNAASAVGYTCVVPLQDADADVMHRLYHNTDAVALCMSNDSDFTAAQINGGCVIYNFAITDDGGAVGSVLSTSANSPCRELFAEHNGVNVLDWPVEKLRIASVLIGNDFFKVSNVATSRGCQIVEKYYQPSATVEANILRLEVVLRDRKFISETADDQSPTLLDGYMATYHCPVLTAEGPVPCYPLPQGCLAMQKKFDEWVAILPDGVSQEWLLCDYGHAGESAMYQNGCNGAPLPPDAVVVRQPPMPGHGQDTTTALHNMAFEYTTKHRQMPWKIRQCIIHDEGCSAKDDTPCPHIVSLFEGQVLDTSLGSAPSKFKAEELLLRLRKELVAQLKQQGYDASSVSTHLPSQQWQSGVGLRLHVACSNRVRNKCESGGDGVGTANAKRPPTFDVAFAGVTASMPRLSDIQIAAASLLPRSGQTIRSVLAGRVPAALVQQFLQECDGNDATRCAISLRVHAHCPPGHKDTADPQHTIDSALLSVADQIGRAVHRATLKFSHCHSVFTYEAGLNEESVIILASMPRGSTDEPSLVPTSLRLRAHIACLLYERRQCILVDCGISSEVSGVLDMVLLASDDAAAAKAISRCKSARDLALACRTPAATWLATPVLGDVKPSVPRSSQALARVCNPGASVIVSTEPVWQITLEMSQQDGGIIRADTVLASGRMSRADTGLKDDICKALANLTGQSSALLLHRAVLHRAIYAALKASFDKGERVAVPFSAGVPLFVSARVIKTQLRVEAADSTHTHPPTRRRVSSLNAPSVNVDWLAGQKATGRPIASILLELYNSGYDGDSRSLRNALRRATNPDIDHFLEQWSGSRLGMMHSAGEALLATAATRRDTVALFKVQERDMSSMSLMATYSILKLWSHEDEASKLYKFNAADILRDSDRWSVYKHLILEQGQGDLEATNLFQRWSPPAGRQVHIVGFAEVSIWDLGQAARCSEQVFLDGTCSTNDKGWTCFAPVCVNAEDQNCTMAFCLAPTESTVNADWVLSTVLPVLYGAALDRTRVIVTDQGPGLMRAVEKAIAANLYGLGQAVHRLCCWHAVYKRWMDKYSSSKKGDAGLGQRVLDMMQLVVRSAESPEQVDSGLSEVKQLLDDRLSDNRISAKQHMILQDEFVTPICAIQQGLFMGRQGTFGTFSVTTAGRMEGEHGWFRNSKVAPKRSSDSMAVAADSSHKRLRAREVERRIQVDRASGKCTTHVSLSEEFRHEYTTFACDTIAARIRDLMGDLKYDITLMSRPAANVRVYQLDRVGGRKYEMEFQRLQRTELTVNGDAQSGFAMCCNRLGCQQDFLPCRHALAFNKCIVAVGDCGPRWLTCVYNGSLDQQWLETSAFCAQDRFCVPVHVPLPEDTMDVQEPFQILDAEPESQASLEALDVRAPEVDDVAALKDLFHTLVHYAKRSPSLMSQSMLALRRLVEDGVALAAGGGRVPSTVHVDAQRPHGPRRGQPFWERHGAQRRS